jgi:hypothetical protein
MNKIKFVLIYSSFVFVIFSHHPILVLIYRVGEVPKHSPFTIDLIYAFIFKIIIHYQFGVNGAMRINLSNQLLPIHYQKSSK